MKIGAATAKKLTQTQKRLLGVVVFAIAVVILVSMYTQLSHRHFRALVVGNTIDLASRADGRIAAIAVAVNEPYRRGSTLVRLENEGLRREIDAVEQQMESLERSLTAERSDRGLERRRFDLGTPETPRAAMTLAEREGLRALGYAEHTSPAADVLSNARPPPF